MEASNDKTYSKKCFFYRFQTETDSIADNQLLFPVDNLQLHPREEERRDPRTLFRFKPPCSVKLSPSTTTYAFKAFLLNSEYNVSCQLFFIVTSNSARIKVELSSESICTISSAVFGITNNSGSEVVMRFHTFKTASVKPYVSVSNEVNWNSILRFNILDRYYNYVQIVFGRISYTLKSNSVMHSLLENCLKTGDYCDLIIKLDNGKEFRVHRLLLAFRSEVFKKTIDSDMLEKTTGIIHIRDTETDVMQEVLNYIYDLPCDLSKSAHNIFRIAHLYDLHELTEMCKNYMIQDITYENFVDILELVSGEEYELKELSDALASFMKKNEKNIVKNTTFIETMINNMETQTVPYLFKLSMQYDLDVKERVIAFILSNTEKLLKNLEFQKLITENPTWSLALLAKSRLAE